MLDDGLYALTYRAEDAGACEGKALAVLRKGKILGSDRGGAVFTGCYGFDAAEETNTVHVRLAVPPEGTLVTGFTADGEGAVLDLVGAVTRTDPLSTVVIEADGHPIEVQLTYLGPLPS